MNYVNNVTGKPVVGQGASFYLHVDAAGAVTVSASTLYFTAINGGYGYQIGDQLIVPDSSLGGGGGR